ncbi:MAG TPA: DUF6484 domain-containing protein [Chitinispirillaceae bacterium]|nr:DUF6484 domain-containing protein [Chitinispirillaceae bacterium]
MARKSSEHHHCDCEKPVETGQQQHREKSSTPLDAILSNISTSQQPFAVSDERINGIVVGKIIDIDEQSVPMVVFSGNVSDTAVQALSTIPVTLDDKSRDVALAFINGDPNMPVIIGFMHVPAGIHATEKSLTGKDGSNTVTVEKDGETVTISAEKEIVLKCGESSITLTRVGKVLLNGTYISSRSKGVNRMRGGSVLLN